MIDYTETLQELQTTLKQIDSLTRCPASDDHRKIAEACVHIVYLAGGMRAMADLNAGDDVR